MDTAEIQKILDTEGDVAADYLEELLEIADLDGDIDIFTEGDRAHVSIVTDSDVLVGRDGEVLSALLELARLAVMTETGKRSRLMLDVAGFREKRRAELQGLATEAVDAVVREIAASRPGAAIIAECHPDNARSRALLRRIGFLATGQAGRRPGRRVMKWRAGPGIDVC